MYLNSLVIKSHFVLEKLYTVNHKTKSKNVY